MWLVSVPAGLTDEIDQLVGRSNDVCSVLCGGCCVCCGLCLLWQPVRHTDEEAGWCVRSEWDVTLKHEALEGCEGISLAVHSVVEEGQSRILLLSSHQWWLLAGAGEMQQWSATKERRSAVRQKKKK